MPPMRSFAVLAAVVIVGACGGGGAAAPTSPSGNNGNSTPPAGEVIATPGNAFNPASLTVARGTTVTFTFQAQHNVTFDNTSGAPSNIGNTSSGSIQRVFANAGTFGFNCTLHAGMRGQVVVN